MKGLKLITLFLCVFLVSGCATRIKYGFDGKLYKRNQARQINALVDIFQDLRTEDEHDGTFSATKNYFYSKDKAFKKNIDQQVTDMLAKHLTKAKLFDTVEVKDVDSDLSTNPAKMKELKAQGFDILILGDLYHFYGYQSGKTGATTAQLFGLAGVLTEAIINRKLVGGRAAYGDLKFIDLHKESVLWSGDLDYDFEHKETFYDGPQIYAIKALKGLNDKMAKKLDKVVDKR